MLRPRAGGHYFRVGGASEIIPAKKNIEKELNMTATKYKSQNEIENFRRQVQIIDEALRRNVEGLTHEDSLMQPNPDGNCLNWVVGHLLWAYNYNLPVLGQEPVMEEENLKRYARGMAPIKEPGEALNFEKLIKVWAKTTERWITGLEQLDFDELNQSAKRHSDDETNESIRDRINGVLFHQSYHVGQTGLLRRLTGKDGAA